MTARQVLDKTDLIGALPPELIGQLRDRTTLERLRRGDVIFVIFRFGRKCRFGQLLRKRMIRKCYITIVVSRD